MGHKLRTVLRDEDNIRQLVRFPHFVKTTPEPLQLCLTRAFIQEVVRGGDGTDFFNPRRAQEIWVIP